MPISVLRRQSAFDDNGGSSGESSRRPSVADGPRRSSLAGISLRLTRSKRTSPANETASDQAAQRLGEAFFALPHEIITHIISHLSTDDFLALRLTSRTISKLLRANAAPITRSLLAHSAPTEQDFTNIQQLYPQPKPCLNESYLLQMIRRQKMVDKMLSIIASFIQMKIYMIPSCPRFDDFAPYRRKLMRRLHPAAWIIYHFLEKFRHMIVYDHPYHLQRISTRSTECPKCVEFVNNLIRSYPPTEVIPAYHFYDLVLQHLRQLSRAPSYVGTIECRLRGWSRRPPGELQLAQVIIIGGIPLLSKLSVLKGTYNQRIEVIGSFIDRIPTSTATRQRIIVATTNPSSSSSPHLKILPPDELSEFESLEASLEPPFSDISEKIISALPSLERFIADDWVVRMFETIDLNAEITSAFGFVQNILAGKDDGPDYLEPVKGFA